MGYTNNDGSELIGGKMPSGVGQALSFDALGNLLVNGQATAALPNISQDFIRTLIVAGQGYSATLEALATGASPAFVGMQLVANSIAKNILVFRAFVFQGQSFSVSRLYQSLTAASDASLTGVGTAVNLSCSNVASALSAINVSVAATTEISGFVGSQIGTGGGGAFTSLDLLQQGEILFIPKNTAGSISVYSKVTTSGNNASVVLYWVEF